MKFVLIIAACAVGYYAYTHFLNPTKIANPVYGEYRVDVDAGGRKLNLLLFGKMVDEGDCKARGHLVWQKLLEGCKECTVQLVDCKSELSPRYAQLFDDHPINLSYLSLTRGSRRERDGRMVIWGITGTEAEQLCEVLRTGMQSRYSGKLRCIGAR